MTNKVPIQGKDNIIIGTNNLNVNNEEQIMTSIAMSNKKNNQKEFAIYQDDSEVDKNKFDDDCSIYEGVLPHCVTTITTKAGNTDVRMSSETSK